MKQYLLGIAFALIIAGCSAPAAPVPSPTPSPAPPVTMPQIKEDPALQPVVLGIYREAVGPGLVVRGRIPETSFVIRVMKGGTELDSLIVEPKEGGDFTAALEVPRQSGVDIRIQSGAQPDTVLIHGAVPDDEQVGLFYSRHFNATRLDVLDKQTMTARISGQALARDGQIWLQYRGDQVAIATEEVRLDKATPEAGTFTIERQLPKGTHEVYFYTLAADGMAVLDLIVPVVIR